jgi:hypothetical protein
MVGQRDTLAAWTADLKARRMVVWWVAQLDSLAAWTAFPMARQWAPELVVPMVRPSVALSDWWAVEMVAHWAHPSEQPLAGQKDRWVHNSAVSSAALSAV